MGVFQLHCNLFRLLNPFFRQRVILMTLQNLPYICFGLSMPDNIKCSIHGLRVRQVNIY